MVIRRIAVFFKVAFNAVTIRYVMVITMTFPTQYSAPRGRWRSSGGQNLGGEGGEGAGVGVAGEGGGGGAAVPDGEEVEGIRDGDAGVGDVVVMGVGGAGVNGGGEEGV
jgi:hypothetical protein